MSPASNPVTTMLPEEEVARRMAIVDTMRREKGFSYAAIAKLARIPYIRAWNALNGGTKLSEEEALRLERAVGLIDESNGQ